MEGSSLGAEVGLVVVGPAVGFLVGSRVAAGFKVLRTSPRVRTHDYSTKRKHGMNLRSFCRHERGFFRRGLCWLKAIRRQRRAVSAAGEDLQKKDELDGLTCLVGAFVGCLVG